MRKKQASPTDAQKEVLMTCYRIHGDGIARLRLDEAVKHPKFQATLSKMNRRVPETSDK